MLVIREEQMQALSKDKDAPKTASDEQDKSICEGKESQDDFYKLPIKKGKLCHWGFKNSSNTMECPPDKSKDKVKLTVKANIHLTGEVIEGVKFALIDNNKKKSDSLFSFSQTYLYDDESDGEFKENCKKTDIKGVKDIELEAGDYTLKVIHIITIEKEKDGSYKRVDEPSGKLPLYRKVDEPSDILPFDKNYILMHILCNMKHCEIILYYKELGCIIDSHMHVMSSHCSTAPMTDKIAYDKTFGILRKRQGGLGSSQFAADLGIGKKCTYDIANNALDDNKITYENIKKELSLYNCELFTPMVVLTVDFEYAHIKGYEGKTIYRQMKGAVKPKPTVAATAGVAALISSTVEPKKSEGIYDDTYQNYYGEDPEAEVFFCDFRRERRTLRKKAKQSIEPCESPNRGFEPWQEQLKQTIKVVKENTWKLIPFFFYDPRRWLIDEEWGKKRKVKPLAQSGLWYKLPLEEVATKDQIGLFVGFKMYTPYGFKPLDPKLPEIDNFYKDCADNQIPIMNHCTPRGSYTHERELYFGLENKKVTEEYNGKIEKEKIEIEKEKTEFEKEKKMIISKRITTEEEKSRIKELSLKIETLSLKIETRKKDVKIKYFNDNFVSPSAWEEVLKKNPNLKICLAHVGGNPTFYEKQYDNSGWAGYICNFCITYPNFYTDVSDVFHAPKDREFARDAILCKSDPAYNWQPSVKGYDPKNNKRILYKVMFGTDWYVTNVTNTEEGKEYTGPFDSGLRKHKDVDYYEYCRYSKEFCDEVTKEFQKEGILTEKEDLWTLFTLVNPFRYLGFVDENAEVNTKLINNIAVGLLCDERVEQVSVNKDELKKNTDIIMKTAQSVSKYLKSDGERLKLVKW
ncbi:MAG: hypothetical protein BWK80_55670 [Desulfobacteraceae bacterium IS3]|nr:MAG: hypothetical protein BWK80_55670 [Desulfobacteraceae bacterium IS3]